jgi:LmbE family N-acetylglucosaminyl deacetylase
VRRAEDSAAAAILGCRTRWLGFFGAIYRASVYAADSELSANCARSRRGLVPLIAARDSRLAGVGGGDKRLRARSGRGITSITS